MLRNSVSKPSRYNRKPKRPKSEYRRLQRLKWLLEGGERNNAFDYPDQEWYYFQMADRFIQVALEAWSGEVDDKPKTTES